MVVYRMADGKELVKRRGDWAMLGMKHKTLYILYQNVTLWSNIFRAA